MGQIIPISNLSSPAMKAGQWSFRAATQSRFEPEPRTLNLSCVPFWKRFLDVGFIFLTAPAWVPLMVGIAVAIKFLSPGPVLFRQQRIGMGGRSFACLKFRTMHLGASTDVHAQHVAGLIRSNRPMTKLDQDDPRLIPLGRLLRSSGLDELPQFFNVLHGEMSVVGPRPCTPQEYEAFTPIQRTRVEALPGLTGLWQVSGKNHTTFNEMIELDLRYLKTSCLWLDVCIVLLTPVVLMGQVLETILDRPARALSSPNHPTSSPPARASSSWPGTPAFKM
jgi:exopolysaccharide production protein ExoY